MPSYFSNVAHGAGHALLHGHGLSHNQSQSSNSSRPTSRAPSPTRTSSRSSIPTYIPVPRREGTIDSTTSDPLSEFTTGSTPASLNSPAYGPYSTSSDMWTPATGTHTPGGSYFPSSYAPVEILLDSDRLVLRGQGGDMNPAYLSGRIELNLPESMGIKEINMALEVKAKVQFSEGTAGSSKNHHFTHPIFHHDWSFLQGDKRHTHTLKAGHHTFPFSLMLDGNLPSTLTTYSGDAVISYRLRANVIRSSFTASNYHAYKNFTLHRTYTPEALEFNQTLEIENTWPGKVMYSLTLPFKAYAAGDEIPVSVKFMPLAKGVRVTSVTSVLKEYSLVHTRHSQHPDSRVAASVKHELRNGHAIFAAEEPQRPPLSWHGSHSHTPSRRVSAHASPVETPLARGSGEGYFGGSSEAGPSQPGEELEEDVQIGDDEVNTHFSIPVPAWTTPSHAIHPAIITHKIKWSCAISNPDGHTSELRCALPIIILDHTLLEEARTSSAATRNLLFGGEGEVAEQIDLPSYSNHVYDRVAIADSGTATGFLSRSTPLDSPHPSLTPPASRPPSRPASPTRGLSRQSTRQADLADDVPERRQLSQFVDSELLRSLGALQSHSGESSPSGTPGPSRGPSRPVSRRSSFTRSGRSSRGNSRASSPERSAGSSVSGGDERPGPERRSSGFHGLLHLPGNFKPMKPLTGSKPILRNSSAALNHLGGNDGIQRNAVSFTNLPERGHRAGHARFHMDGAVTPDEVDVDPLSQVPSYAIASRGFLGGGVVPLDSGPPTYDASERDPRSRRGSLSGEITRPRSESHLAELGQGAAEAAEAEHRAGGGM